MHIAHRLGAGPRPLRIRVSHVCTRHDFATITPHVLRHGLASQLIATRMDAVTIASILGHSPDVLLRTYAHAFDSRKREAVEALGEARKAARVAE